MATQSTRIWLHSRRADLAVLMVPMVVVGALGALALRAGGGRLVEQNWASWSAQFVLGNTTHVLLTFLLLGMRKDVLDAAPGQRRLVIAGTILTFTASFAMFYGTQISFPIWAGFGYTIGYIFATHHRLSQMKGVWSLYNVVGHQAGLARPPAIEQRFQRTLVPLGLVLILVRVLFVPNHAWSRFAVLQPVPSLAAPLGYSAVYVLLGVWVTFVGAVLYSLRGTFRTSAKGVYVGAYGASFAVLLALPVWGSALIGAVHGLEYFVLTGRMLKDGAQESAGPGPFRRALAMLLAISPALVVGIYTVPAALSLAGAGSKAVVYGEIALNAVVMSHYFTDAVIYRFRIPSVRAVMLRRLQLG